ncbi:hypothetical protein GCM10027416_16150 [Okibacterium endophyticum]
MVAFLSSALTAAAVIVVAAVTHPPDPGAVSGVAGAALSLSAFVSTIVYNVPRNNRIARLDPHSAASASEWTVIERQWTRANHLRGATSALGAVTLIVAVGLNAPAL